MQTVRFGISTVRQRRTVLDKRKPSRRKVSLFLLLHLFYKRKKKCGNHFFESAGFSAADKSGITFAVSHIFVFCPIGRLRNAALELAAVIGEGNVVIHDHSSFHSSGTRNCRLAAIHIFCRTVRLTATL